LGIPGRNSSGVAGILDSAGRAEPEEWHQAKSEAVNSPQCGIYFEATFFHQPQDHSGLLPDTHRPGGFPILESAAFAQSSGAGVLDRSAAGTAGEQVVLHHHRFRHSWEFYRRWLASLFSYRRAIAIMCLGFFISFMGAYAVPRDYSSLMIWWP
jgi:hypothetical protein